MPPLAGVRIGTATAGYKPWTRADVTLVEFAAGTTVAGVLTQSKCPSPEVEACRAALPGGSARALMVNAGNSNAFTGAAGRDASRAQVEAVAAAVGCAPGEVFVASTGVIGVPLPVDRATGVVAAAHAALGNASFEEATHAIGTTDTFAKGATASAIVGGRRVTIHGLVKGSGMIAPDMATMLGFVFTDAAVSAPFLQYLLTAATANSFNATVDESTANSVPFGE